MQRSPVGFIGLGIMGRPMAQNLVRAGYPVVVYTRTASKLAEAERWGARPAGSPAEVARACDIVISIVTDSPDVEAVALGPGGIIEAARPGLTYVDMSTILPAVARRVAARLKERGAAMLDAPVSGGDTGAKAGTLSIMVGGDAAAVERCRPVFEVLGANVVHVGPIGMGQTVKLCNQVMVALTLLGVAEGLALAAGQGADLGKVLEVVTKGAARSFLLESLGPKMVEGDFAPGFMVRLQQKDLRLALEAAEQVRQPLPGTALVTQLFRAVEAIGAGDEGTQALIKALAHLGQRRIGEEAGS